MMPTAFAPSVHVPVLQLSTLLLAAMAMMVAACTTQGGKAVKIHPPPERLMRGSLLDQARPPLGAPVYYEPPTLQQRLELEKILPRFFRDLVDGKTDFSSYAEPFALAGFRMQRLQRGDDVWIVVFEGGPHWRGAGCYVFRVGKSAEELIVEAPHSYFDRHTGRISERLFLDGHERGFYFNTLHRYRATPEEKKSDPVHPADMAHVTDSFFHMFTVEYLMVEPQGVIVQIHGFDRQPLKDKSIGVVVSDGTDKPSPMLREFAATLGEDFGGTRVAVYSEHVNSLGATSNAQGRWIRMNHRGHFIHVELSSAVRQKLLDSGQLLHKLGEAIARVGSAQ